MRLTRNEVFELSAGASSADITVAVLLQICEQLQNKMKFNYIKTPLRVTSKVFYFYLFEILNGRLKHLKVKVTLNVLVKSIANSLGVTHLTKYVTVGRSNTLDSRTGVVGVKENV